MILLYSEISNRSDGSGTARRLLQAAVRREFGVAMPEISRTENGKPYFKERPDIHFSLSHTKTRAFAIVADVPVGFDAEIPRAVGGRTQKWACSEAELREFDFFDLWVMKESCVKLYGGRLFDMRRFAMARSPGGARSSGPDGRTVFLRPADGIPDTRAAVASFEADVFDTFFLERKKVSKKGL